jgi:hypothetical protein
VSLISNGGGDSMSFLADNSDSGEDVFVIARAALVGADRDVGEYDGPGPPLSLGNRDSSRCGAES